MMTLENFVKKKQYLICIDSDGCIMDTMDIKHIRCFGPCLISEWRLEEWQSEILKRWNEINLYSMTRGVNRFKGLALIMVEIDRNYKKIENLDTLLDWVEKATELSNSGLKQALATQECLILKKALNWSETVNDMITKLPDYYKMPFEGASQLLCSAHNVADVAIVSSANIHAVIEEWGRCGLLEYVDVVLSQNEGTKSHCIKIMLEKGYDKQNTLMIGDAVGDRDAALKNNVCYFPILVKQEKKSFSNFLNTGLNKFIEGKYFGIYQEGMLNMFEKNLSPNIKCVDLSQKPFYLSKKDIEWVETTINGMTEEEKVGQLFVNMVTSREPNDLIEVLNTYHVGGIRYQNAEAQVIYNQNKVLQENTKIPLLIASNCEAGGNGCVLGGTIVANGSAVAATGDEQVAYEVACIGAIESKAVGCNWNFAPLLDMPYNWRNTIVQMRAYSSNVDDVIRYSKAFCDASKSHNMATCAKHFPGDGTEENDQHLIMGVNNMSCEEWDNTFGKAYKTIIDDGVLSIMIGHIALPSYSKKLRRGMTDSEIRPATLAPELITDLLKGELGFNGVAVTDASHMIGLFGATVPRSEQVPGAIAAGCDMFLFFNDRAEDFAYMLDGYRNGTITEERMQDSLRRILGMKAALGLHKQQKTGTLIGSLDGLSVIGCDKHKKIAKKVSDKYITLVKDTKKYLPMTPEKYKRLKLVFISGEGRVIAGKLFKDNGSTVRAEIVRQLEVAGFEVDDSEPDEKGKTEDLRKKYDACLLVINLTGMAQSNSMRLKWTLPIQQPWYVSEIPTMCLSLNFTNHLIDIPMVKTYVNAYMNSDEAVEAAISKMMGNSSFKGTYSENVFCDRWDTRL